jgi:hypothetical protein
MHGAEKRENFNRRADSCCILCSLGADAVRRRDVGRKHGVTEADAMRRKRTARGCAIVAEAESVAVVLETACQIIRSIEDIELYTYYIRVCLAVDAMI